MKQQCYSDCIVNVDIVWYKWRPQAGSVGTRPWGSKY